MNMTNETNPNAGSIAAGFLLTFGLNLFICLSWIPLCGLAGNHGASASGFAGTLGVIMFFGAVGIGLTQFLHVIPTILILSSQKRTLTMKGTWIATAVTGGIWALAALMLTVGAGTSLWR
jgi:hypothetical protein